MWPGLGARVIGAETDAGHSRDPTSSHGPHLHPHLPLLEKVSNMTRRIILFNKLFASQEFFSPVYFGCISAFFSGLILTVV